MTLALDQAGLAFTDQPIRISFTTHKNQVRQQSRHQFLNAEYLVAAKNSEGEMLLAESETLILSPTGFGDINTHELSEAECDIGMDINLARKIRLHSHDFTIAV